MPTWTTCENGHRFKRRVSRLKPRCRTCGGRWWSERTERGGGRYVNEALLMPISGADIAASLAADKEPAARTAIVCPTQNYRLSAGGVWVPS